ncbi:MAG: aspartate dehydrogenase [Rhodospirillales bacterium]
MAPTMDSPAKPALRVGIGGFGAIGRAIGRKLDGGVPGLVLAAVSANRPENAERYLADFARPVPVVTLAELADAADVIVECAPSRVFADVAEPAIERGRIFMPLSVGALLNRLDLVERAEATGARIIVPTGALIGLDAVRAAAEGTIRSVTLVTRKPPAGLKGAPYLAEHDISLDGVKEPMKIFEGSARDGAKGFPANVNVAAALSLAGIGPDKTRLEIWADPTIERNIQHVEIEADSASFTMTIRNVPDPANPRTGRITALSVIAALRGLVSPLKVGT